MAADNLNERETTVVIYVRDLNDLPPVFENQTYVLDITEESVFLDLPLLKVCWVCFACVQFVTHGVYA